MRYTLLEVVQNVLSGMNSDEVNSISDTVEAEQVALLARESYEKMIAMREWPWDRRLLHLDAVGDSDKPVLMKIPEDVNRIEDLRYDISCDEKQYKTLTYLSPVDFLDEVYKYDATNTTTGQFTMLTRPGDVDSTVTILYKSDQQPQYWTSFDDTYIVFNSYDSTVDDTITSSKTLVHAEKQPSFTLADAYVINIPEQFWELYINDLRVTAWLNIKEQAHSKYAADYRAAYIRLQRSQWRENGDPKKPNYGRR